MSSSLHPYRYWIEDDKYLFRTPSGALYVAYFLDLCSLAENLFTFNFDRVSMGDKGVVDTQVCDTVCTILASFFKEHINSILIVCDSADGREKARMRLFNAWFNRIAPEGLIKVDRTGRTSSYELFVSILLWQDNPAKEQLKALLEDYCNMVT